MSYLCALNLLLWDTAEFPQVAVREMVCSASLNYSTIITRVYCFLFPMRPKIRGILGGPINVFDRIFDEAAAHFSAFSATPDSRLYIKHFKAEGWSGVSRVSLKSKRCPELIRSPHLKLAHHEPYHKLGS